MFKAPIVVGLLLITACYIGVKASPCPYPNYSGSVHSNQIIAALNSGSIPLNEAIETQCYNYSLPYQLKNAPQVAIAVHDFESQHSNTMFFFIKTLHSLSPSTIPFVIKTYWSYTRWTQISFSFIAEDRSDLQSGYYQIDSGLLSGCENGKQVEILMPIKNNFNQLFIHHYLFLHGFQIATVPYGLQERSPYQFQIVKSFANTSGITIAISVTSTTQVDSVYISYIAYQETTLDLIVGSYDFDRNNSLVISHTPDVSVPRSFARIYGIKGFIINYNTYRLGLQTKWDGFSFTFSLFQFTSLTQYFSFNYIFFIGSQCQDCPGYPIQFNGTCTNTCPPNTVRTPDNLCRDCGKGKTWNGKQCIKQCPHGQYLNVRTNQCECPPSLHWNGEFCISCTAGKIFVPQFLSCQCPQPLRWNGFVCAQIDQCKNGKIFDLNLFVCVCNQTTRWNGTFCQVITPCKGGQVHDSNFNCVCPANFYWNGQSCTYSPCIGGQIWQGTKCVCPAGKNFNGTMCIECINGQIWDQINKQCTCQDGYKWNSQYCQRTYQCTGNRIWNATYEQCICRDSHYWAGFACLPIPTCRGGQYWNMVLMRCVCSTTFQWNGTSCVICRNGQIWDTATLKCVCPPGTVTIAGKCQIQQQCTGGKEFIPSILQCICPQSTTWNGDYCISNACSDGRVYNPQFMSCQCPDGKVWNNSRCVPPQISCNNGRIWNPAIYACECPEGTFPNYNKCDPIPICRNGMTYQPLTNQCACPYGKVLQNHQCVDPNCPTGQYWNGYECQVISCPPPSYFYENRCIYGGPSQCTYGYFWNGQTCVLHPPRCPSGTQWKSNECVSNACQSGFYLNSNGQCTSLPQQCTPPAIFNGDNCRVSGGQCPQKTFLNNGKCQPYVPCSNGHIWDYDYLKCICPSGFISNGVSCVQCSNGKSWDPSLGCVCPQGSFDTGTSCQSLSKNRCSSIQDAIWQNEKCKCRPGFTKLGFQCMCYGTQIGSFCDKCSHKPNSEWLTNSNICRCLDGYTEIRGNCIRNSLSIGTNSPSECNVGTYFDLTHRMCLPCPDGCLSCFDCYRCRACRPEFIYNPSTQLCVQKCGDGNRFVLQCDDGNNKDGDGCSRDCKVQPGYQCTGGSPDNQDSCYTFRPERVTLQRTGQIRKSTSIVLNIKLNYLPSSLLFSGDCQNNCDQVLTGSLIGGDRSALSITSAFIIGTKYTFAVTIDFGRPYIGEFTISLGVNQKLIPKYFGSIPTDTLEFQVKPNFLTAITQDRQDVL